MSLFTLLLACSSTPPADPPLTPPIALQEVCVDVKNAENATIEVNGVTFEGRCHTFESMYSGPDVLRVRVTAAGRAPWTKDVEVTDLKTTIDVEMAAE